MYPIYVGQTLWWRDHKNNTEGTVEVTEVNPDGFVVCYQGKSHPRPYCILGKKLFTSTHRDTLCKQNNWLPDMPKTRSGSVVAVKTNRNISGERIVLKEKTELQKYYERQNNQAENYHQEITENALDGMPQYRKDYYQTLHGHDEPVRTPTSCGSSSGSDYVSPVRGCSNCALARNGTCSGMMKGTRCQNYQPIQLIAQGERANWPKYGDACAVGMGNKKRYK